MSVLLSTIWQQHALKMAGVQCRPISKRNENMSWSDPKPCDFEELGLERPISNNLKLLIERHGMDAIFNELMTEMNINPVWARRKLEL